MLERDRLSVRFFPYQDQTTQLHRRVKYQGTPSSSQKLALVKRDEKGSKQELETELAQDRETNTGAVNHVLAVLDAKRPNKAPRTSAQNFNGVGKNI